MNTYKNKMLDESAKAIQALLDVGAVEINNEIVTLLDMWDMLDDAQKLRHFALLYKSITNKEVRCI